MDKLKFERVRTQEQFDSLKVFAESFGHKLSTTMPIVTFSRGNNIVGYYQILQQPVVMMSYHPEACSPRDFKEASDKVKSHLELSSMSDSEPNGVCYTLISEDSPIPEEAVTKLGFDYTGLKLYKSNVLQ